MDGLQSELNDVVTFRSFDAKDDAEGEALFRSLNLPGHPSIVIYDASGEEIYRHFGVPDEAELRAALESAVGDGE